MANKVLRWSIVAAAVVGVAGCAVLTGEIDDGGRAAREMQNAPVGDHDLIEPFGDPSIQVIDQKVDTPLGGRADQPMRRDRTEPPAEDDDSEN